MGWGWRGRVGHGQARRGSGKRNGTRTTWKPNWRRGRPGSAVTTHHEQVERSQHAQHTHTNTSRRQAGPLLAARVRGRRQMSYGRQFPMRNTPRPREEDRRGASPRPHGCARAGRHHASRSSTHASALPPRLSEDEGTAPRSARRAMPRYNLSPTEALALPPRETRRKRDAEGRTGAPPPTRRHRRSHHSSCAQAVLLLLSACSLAAAHHATPRPRAARRSQRARAARVSPLRAAAPRTRGARAWHPMRA